MNQSATSTTTSPSSTTTTISPSTATTISPSTTTTTISPSTAVSYLLAWTPILLWFVGLAWVIPASEGVHWLLPVLYLSFGGLIALALGLWGAEWVDKRWPQ